MIIILLYIITGILKGLASGLLGVGGAIIVVPSLIFIFYKIGFPSEFIIHFAVGTSLAITVFTSASSFLAHHKYENIIWSVARYLLPTVILGSIVGVILSHFVTARFLTIILGVILLFVAIRMFIKDPISADTYMIRPWLLMLAGFLIAIISALCGVGGGFALVPFLILCGVPTRKAVGTSIVCVFALSFIASLGYWFSYSNQVSWPHSFGYVYWPALVTVACASVICARIGAYLNKKFDTIWIKRIFGVLLLFVSVQLFIGI